MSANNCLDSGDSSSKMDLRDILLLPLPFSTHGRVSTLYCPRCCSGPSGVIVSQVLELRFHSSAARYDFCKCTRRRGRGNFLARRGGKGRRSKSLAVCACALETHSATGVREDEEVLMSFTADIEC